MPNLNLSTLAGDLSAGVAFVERLAPIAAELGLPVVATNIAGELADVTRVALDRVKDAQDAKAATSQADLEAILNRLEAMNDAEDATALASKG